MTDVNASAERAPDGLSDISGDSGTVLTINSTGELSFDDLMSKAKNAENALLQASYFSAAVRVAKYDENVSSEQEKSAEHLRDELIAQIDNDGPMGQLSQLAAASQ